MVTMRKKYAQPYSTHLTLLHTSGTLHTMKQKSKPTLQIRLVGNLANTVSEWSQLTGVSCNRVVQRATEAAFAAKQPHASQDYFAWLQAEVEVEKQKRLARTRIAQARK